MKTQVMFVSAAAACLLILLHLSEANTVKKHPVPNDHNHCVTSDGARHPLDNHWFDPLKCKKYVCQKNKRGDFIIRTVSCDSFPDPLPDGCRKEKHDGNFPHCCPKLIC